ncbi:MAG: AAA family ATPase [Desulfobacterales bacterium]
MLKRELILRNPVQSLAGESESILRAGHFGAILARAGVGKTALIVQIALHAMLRGRNVVHVSLNQPVTRTNLWYREIFGNIARQVQIERAEALWGEILPHRFIMTFRTEGFSVPKLEERLTDLIEQKIFLPRLLIIDGLSFDEPQREDLAGLKHYARLNELGVWFSIRTHRHEAPGLGGLPRQILDVEDLFEVALSLVPVGEEIHVNVLKGITLPPEHAYLALDPATMLVKNRIP